MKKKNPYEVLGVDKDADSNTVKKAYRKRAQAAHPDLGGSHELMAEVNAAKDVLLDPARRLLYDSTGETERRPLEEEIRAALMSAFMEAISKDVPVILNYVNDEVERRITGNKLEYAKGLKLKDKLTARRDKIKTKDEQNLFHMVIDQQLKALEESMNSLNHQTEIFEGMKIALKSYSSSEELPQINFGVHSRVIRYEDLIAGMVGGAYDVKWNERDEFIKGREEP